MKYTALILLWLAASLNIAAVIYNFRQIIKVRRKAKSFDILIEKYRKRLVIARINNIKILQRNNRCGRA